LTLSLLSFIIYSSSLLLREMFREVADRTMDDHVAALITCVALAACGAAQTISETDQGKNFVKLLKDKGFKDVGAPEWEDDSEQTTRRVNGRTVRRTTKERVVEITVTMNGCTVEFEQVRNPNALSTDYVLDESPRTPRWATSRRSRSRSTSPPAERPISSSATPPARITIRRVDPQQTQHPV
jgi:hypothetical protein